jgi:hypothetical protein
MEKES